MKVGGSPENLLERVALWLNLAPKPLIDTQVAFNAARAIMAGTELGVFDALDGKSLSADDVARACGTHPKATAHLLGALVSLGYLTYAGGVFGNAPVAQKWCTTSSPFSVRDKLLFQTLEWDWMAKLEDFVRTGAAMDIHSTMPPEAWRRYQDAMRALAAGIAPDVARALPLAAGATRMLDIGGSHGLYSIAACRLHPALSATILELPAAIERAQAIVADEAARAGVRDRVQHRAGDALQDDLGESTWDLVFISNVVHHFSVEQNVALAKRVQRALKPGGAYVIGEFARQDTPGVGGANVGTMNLYFAMTSASGTWSLREMSSWLAQAGLTPAPPRTFLRLPTYTLVIGRK